MIYLCKTVSFIKRKDILLFVGKGIHMEDTEIRQTKTNTTLSCFYVELKEALGFIKPKNILLDIFL